MRTRLWVAVLPAIASAAGSGILYAWLLPPSGWAVKWYVGIGVAVALALGVAAAALRPRTPAAIAAWCVASFLLGLIVAPLIGLLIVYRISGATD